MEKLRRRRGTKRIIIQIKDNNWEVFEGPSWWFIKKFENGLLISNKKATCGVDPISISRPHQPIVPTSKAASPQRLPCNIVNIEHNHKLFLESRGPNALDGLQGFCFETTSDGHGDADVAQDIISRCESIREHMFLPFYDLLVRLEDSSTKGLVPPVTCLVSDCAMSFTIQVAEELSLPIVLIQPASACSLLSGLHFRSLFYKGLVQLKGMNFSSFFRKVHVLE